MFINVVLTGEMLNSYTLQRIVQHYVKQLRQFLVRKHIIEQNGSFYWTLFLRLG